MKCYQIKVPAGEFTTKRPRCKNSTAGVHQLLIAYQVAASDGNWYEATMADREINPVPIAPEFSSGTIPVTGSRYCQPSTSIMM